MASETFEQALDRAASYCGMEQEFWDIFGNRHIASQETKQAIVSALGLPAGNRGELEAGMKQRELAAWTRLLDPAYVVSGNGPIRVRLQIPSGQDDWMCRCELYLEDGGRREFEKPLGPLAATGSAFGWVRKELPLPPDLPMGYHDLRVQVGDLTGKARLIVTPDRAYLPRFLEDGGKAAGLTLTLYGIRSGRNWGCGDFRDLRDVCEWAAKEVGVSFLALNPLHAIHNRQPYNASPYLPNSIFYQNSIYLDIEALEDFQESPEAQELWRSEGTQSEICELRASGFVEYERVHALKRRFLRLAFRRAQEHPDPWRTMQLSVFIEKEGDLLHRFATYCALDEALHAGDPNLWVWPSWPEGFRDPESTATRQWQQEHADEILFYRYVQWQIDRQLIEAQEHAKSVGMKIGLYHDLALATDRCGSDFWAHRPYFVEGCRVGSPPDDFSPNGQDWAFPPPNTNHHWETGYRLFVESIRKTCRHGGALRIDHVMRFFRLFWIPDGAAPVDGAYVRDRWEDLLRILALESVRHKVLVVGEDLGTVEPEVRENLARFGILSYRLLYFERRPGGEYRLAGEYPRQSLVSSTTHDLPTLSGFWINADIDARRRAGLLDEGGYRAQTADRMREKQKMLDALWASRLLPDYVSRNAAEIPELTGELHNAVIGFLCSTPSMLMVVNQEDLTKEPAQQNLPGTTEQYRNWSKKMRFSLDEMQSNPEAAGSVRMFRHWLERSGRS